MAQSTLSSPALVQAVLELVARSDDGVFAVNGRQRIAFWSDRMAEMSGLQAEAVLGRQCYDVLHGRWPHGGDLCSPACPVYAAANAGKRPESFEMVATGLGERELSVSVIATGPLPEEPLLVHLVRDVTRKERRERLARSGIGSTAVTDGALPRPRPKIRRRELEVLRLIADGYSTPGVAALLGISRITVHNHVQRALKALGAHNRREAVREVARIGLI
jgi:DNA-binding CsgD family transcriptional regulator